MRRSSKLWYRPEDGRHTRSIAGVVALLLLSGCVSSGTHQEVVTDRDRLQFENEVMKQKADHLEVSNTSLEAERVRLYDQLEDLRVESEALEATRSALEADVMRLSASEGELSSRLQETYDALQAANLEAAKLRSTYDGLVDDLESELQKGAIEIEQLRSGLRVAVSDEILFRSGSAKIDSEGREVLEKVAENIARLDYAVDVEGHTDNVKIRGPLQNRYPSNWELAAARASSVVRLFEKVGISGERLQAISRAEFAPVASNQDAEGRSLNRRIEIRLRPREGGEVRQAPLSRKQAASETLGEAAPEAARAEADAPAP